VQPTRSALMKDRAPGAFYHVNALQAWGISADGEARNVYL